MTANPFPANRADQPWEWSTKTGSGVHLADPDHPGRSMCDRRIPRPASELQRSRPGYWCADCSREVAKRWPTT